MTVLLAILATGFGAMVTGIWIGLQIAQRWQQAAQRALHRASAAEITPLSINTPRRSTLNTRALDALGHSQRPKPFSVSPFSEQRSV